MTVHRPARQNWGVDFTYQLTGIAGPQSNWRPTLRTIFDDIGAKIYEDLSHAPVLFRLIDQVYRCREPSDALTAQRAEVVLEYQSGLPLDALLALLKWVFLSKT